jgi:hypothetical protein
MFREPALAAGGRANDQANLPGLAEVRQLEPERLRRAIFDRQVEHPRHLADAEAVADRGVELEFVDRHSDGDDPALSAAGGELFVKLPLIALVVALDE